MLDFWFTLGAMVVKPALLKEVDKAKPVFTAIASTLTENGKKIAVKGAGYLEENSTQTLRDKVQLYLRNNFPMSDITVSLYTAGKICQLWNLHQSGLANAMKDAGSAYAAASKKLGVVASKHATVLMGACLVDDALALALRTPGAQDAAVQFFITPSDASPDWKLVSTWLNDPRFESAQKSLLAFEGWDRGCLERFFFYESFKRAAN